jgi:hypothetical protein
VQIRGIINLEMKKRGEVTRTNISTKGGDKEEGGDDREDEVDHVLLLLSLDVT